MLAGIRRRGKPLVIMVTGEALQSALHFGLNLALLHVLPAREYGIFAIVMVIGGIALTYVRAFTAMPASIRIGGSKTRRSADVHDVTFGSAAFALSVSMGVLTAIALRLWLGSDSIAAGAFIGCWSLRSYVRTAVFARGRLMLIAAGDAIFAGSGTLMALAIFRTQIGGPLQDTFVSLALANGLGMATMLLAARAPVRLSLRLSLRSRYVALWPQLSWAGISVTISNLQGQGMALLVATIAGPAAYAPIAAALVLFVPIRLVGAALMNMMQPLLSAHLASGETRKVRAEALAWTAVAVGGGILYGAVLLTAMPLLRTQIFEATSIRLVGALAWAVYIASVAYAMPRIVLEAVGRFRSIAVISAAGSAVGVVITTALLMTVRPEFSLLGAVASELTVLVLSWIAMTRSLGAAPGSSMMQRTD